MILIGNEMFYTKNKPVGQLGLVSILQAVQDLFKEIPEDIFFDYYKVTKRRAKETYIYKDITIEDNKVILSFPSDLI